MIKRILNSLNPRAPRGLISDSQAWVRRYNARHGDQRAKIPIASFQELEPQRIRYNDLRDANPITESDRFLKASYRENEVTCFSGRKLFSVRNARVFGNQGVVISPDNKVFADLSYHEPSGQHPALNRLRYPKPKHLEGNFLNLCFPDSANYYHWLIESVPHIKSVIEFLPAVDGVFIPREGSFHAEVLNAFGVKDSQLVPLNHDSHFICENLYFPEFNYGYAPYSWFPTWSKKRVLTNQNDLAPRKLFIARTNTDTRQITNMNEVRAVLDKHQVEEYYPSHHSFLDQAKTYHSAEVVISPHGAGLTNILFCKPGTKVLEIFPAFWTPLCYFHLAKACELDYNFMIDLPTNTAAEILAKHDMNIQPDESRFDGGIEVPLEKLEIFLQSLAN